MVYNHVPTLSQDEGSLSRYIEEIKKFPVLSVEEEQRLSRQYHENNDLEAAHRLVTSHLRYVVKIATGYRYYGLPMAEVISEGNIGLMRAVKGFIPEKGVRLATYAIWWIKSSIHEYVLRSWSLVKIGTTTQQRKLFFNLRKARSKIKSHSLCLNEDQAQMIAQDLKVDQKEVLLMEQRLIGDASLNSPMASDEGQTYEWQDTLICGDQNQEEILVERADKSEKEQILQEGLALLKPREREILCARHLKEKAETLEELAGIYQISRERVRQIEKAALKKLSSFVKNHSLVIK